MDADEFLNNFKEKGLNISADDIEGSLLINVNIPSYLKNFYNTLPIPSKTYIVFDKNYDEELKVYLASLLGSIIEDKNIVLKCLTPNNILIWKQALTHISYSYEKNYEELEFIGDSILKCSFKHFLLKKILNISSRALTEFTNQYLATISLCQITILLKTSKWLIHTSLNLDDLNVKVCEDLFESFIGALYKILDNIAYGLGNIYINKYIEELFSEIDLNERMVYGTSKTSLIQRGEIIGLKTPPAFITVSTETTNKKVETKIYINPDALIIFKNAGFNITKKDLISPIGVSIQNAKKTSINVAYKKAEEYMENTYDFTYKNCVYKGYMHKLKKLDENLVELALRKAKNKYGCDYLEFYTPTSSHGVKHITTILYGIDSRIEDPIIENRPKTTLLVYTHKKCDEKNSGNIKNTILREFINEN